MRLFRLIVAAAFFAWAGAAQATTVVIFVEPLTLERYARIFDTAGPDRMLMCMAPPSTAGCTEVRIRKMARR